MQAPPRPALPWAPASAVANPEGPTAHTKPFPTSSPDSPPGPERHLPPPPGPPNPDSPSAQMAPPPQTPVTRCLPRPVFSAPSSAPGREWGVGPWKMVRSTATTPLSLALSDSVSLSMKWGCDGLNWFPPAAPRQFTMFRSSPPVPRNVTVFGHGIFAEVIKLRVSSYEWALIQ